MLDTDLGIRQAQAMPQTPDTAATIAKLTKERDEARRALVDFLQKYTTDMALATGIPPVEAELFGQAARAAATKGTPLEEPPLTDEQIHAAIAKGKADADRLRAVGWQHGVLKSPETPAVSAPPTPTDEQIEDYLRRSTSPAPAPSWDQLRAEARATDEEVRRARDRERDAERDAEREATRLYREVLDLNTELRRARKGLHEIAVALGYAEGATFEVVVLNIQQLQRDLNTAVARANRQPQHVPTDEQIEDYLRRSTPSIPPVTLRHPLQPVERDAFSKRLVVDPRALAATVNCVACFTKTGDVLRLYDGRCLHCGAEPGKRSVVEDDDA